MVLQHPILLLIFRAGTINRYIDYRNRFLKISDYRFKVFQIDNRKCFMNMLISSILMHFCSYHDDKVHKLTADGI